MCAHVDVGATIRTRNGEPALPRPLSRRLWCALTPELFSSQPCALPLTPLTLLLPYLCAQLVLSASHMLYAVHLIHHLGCVPCQSFCPACVPTLPLSFFSHSLPSKYLFCSLHPAHSLPVLCPSACQRCACALSPRSVELEAVRSFIFK